MKLTPLLALLVAFFFTVGCGSSSDSTSDAQESNAMGEEEVDVSTDNTAEDGLLMDQYLSGEIPGYDEE